MFKTAASKLAHNTTLPALGGNQDLRPLQDLITAEKTVIIALQKLGSDYSKAAEALRAWGQAEGDDLGDILNASTALLAQFSSALSQYAAHGHTIRDTLKSIRSREEALDELKRRRRTVHRKAEDADKKLSKMNPEHKHLESQTELLYRLQDEIRSLDSEIMSEEAMLGDFKRSSTRAWLGLKFGGLVECCEKGSIVGSYGKLLVAEIPEETTQPGMPRSLYYGHSKINGLVNDAMRGVSQVALDNTPGGGRLPPLPGVPPPSGSLDSPSGSTGQYPPPPSAAGGDGLFGPRGSPPLLPPQSTGGSLFGPSNTMPTPTPASKPPVLPPLDTPTPQSTIDDFGVPIVRHEGGGAGGAGRFATFPVKLRQDSLPTSVTSTGTSTFHHHPQHPNQQLHPPRDPPPPFDFLHSPLTPPSLNLNTRNDLGADSFSLSIAEALGEEGEVWKGRLSGSAGADLPPPTPAKPSGGSSAITAGASSGAAAAANAASSPPPQHPTSLSDTTSPGPSVNSITSPTAATATAAGKTFAETNPWATPPKEDSRHLLSASAQHPQQQQQQQHHRRSVSEQLSDNDSALLAYMTGAADVDGESSSDEEDGVVTATRRTRVDNVGGDSHTHPKEEKEKEKSESLKPLGGDTKPSRIQSYRGEVVQQEEDGIIEDDHSGSDDDDERGLPSVVQRAQQPQPPSPESKRVARVPPPTFEPEEPHHHHQQQQQQQAEKDRQKEMDAAAARELTRELESTNFVPPKISPSSGVVEGGNSVPTSPRRQVELQDEVRGREYQPQLQPQQPQQQLQQQPQQQQQQQQFSPPDREPSPLVPPSAPFAQRAVSPHPFPESQPPVGLGSPPRLRQGQSLVSGPGSGSGSGLGSPNAGSQAGFQLQDPGSPVTVSSPPRPTPTAAQAIAQAYHQQQQQQMGQGQGGSGNPYDTVYPPAQPQPQQQIIPPRFQAAYGHESQSVPPPRFQGMRTGSSPVPPRFQNPQQQQNQQQQMPFEGEQIPGRTSVESIGGSGSAQGSPLSSPYRTPLEYPASSNAGSPRLGAGVGLAGVGAGGGLVGAGGSPGGSSNTTTGAAASPLVPPGARTISAAAFKRPQPQPNSTLPAIARGFGSSGPYPVINAPSNSMGGPQQQLFSSSSSEAPPPPGNANSNLNNTAWQQHPKQHLRVSRDLPPPPPGAAPPRPESEYYDSAFDYIGAYAHSDQGSPMSGEFPQNANASANSNSNPNANLNPSVQRHSGGPRPMSGGGYFNATNSGAVPVGLSPGQVIPSSAAQQQQQHLYQQGGVGGYPNSMSGSGGAGGQPPSVLSPGYGQHQQQQQAYGRYGGDDGLR
ncbi:hypothetical protein MD484_g7595, partial [Candolleomyces efflorescens]